MVSVGIDASVLRQRRMGIRDRTYRFVVNGRTGRVQGERPYSKWKIAFAVLLGLVFALAVGYFYAMNQ